MKKIRGCLNCPESEDILDIKTKLYNGFGGYAVYKDGKYFWAEIMNKDYEKCATVRKVENMVALDLKAKWEIKLDLPLRSAIWLREAKNKWVLTETGLGFA